MTTRDDGIPKFDNQGINDLSIAYIYDSVDVFNSKYDDNDYIDENIDDDDLEYSECEYNCENCFTCYFNNNGMCDAKGISVKDLYEYCLDCWLYRDKITLRASIDFQDDYDRDEDW